MGRLFSLTYPTAAVLLAIESGHRYGFDIMDVTGLPDGTVYPILRRLERLGLGSIVQRKRQRAERSCDKQIASFGDDISMPEHAFQRHQAVDGLDLNRQFMRQLHNQVD